jgi:hypothetical protein
MPNKLELSGRNFGRLTVICEDGRDKHGAVMWLCDCTCGGSQRTRGSQLISGKVASCGCGISIAASRAKTHGETHTALYARWRSMISRVAGNPNYGARGIMVCQEWASSFEAFAADMRAGFSEGLTLERMDVDGDYCASNCCWKTLAAQQLNKRTNHRVEWRGRTMVIKEWADALGLSPNTLLYRLRRGWSLERAMTFKVAEDVLLEIANRPICEAA